MRARGCAALPGRQTARARLGVPVPRRAVGHLGPNRTPAGLNPQHACFLQAVHGLAPRVGDALFQPGEVRDGHHVGQDRPQRRQPDRLGFGGFGERRDQPGCPGDTMRHLADGLIEGLAANRLDLGPGLGLVGPALGRPLGHAVGGCPLSTRFARRQRDGELALEARSFFFRHGALDRATARATAPPFGPTCGSQPGAQAGRCPEWARKKMARNGAFSRPKKRHFPASSRRF